MYGLKLDVRARKAEAVAGIWVVRRWMSQSTSSSMMRAVEELLLRKARSALRWPSHARAEPRVIVETCSARRLDISSGVHAGCAGMEMSISVMFAARRRPSRRGDCCRDTAMTEPNCTAKSARRHTPGWNSRSHLLQELRWHAPKPYVATHRLHFD
jgi:hypothetical protein